jgi:hypothetical protein
MARLVNLVIASEVEQQAAALPLLVTMPCATRSAAPEARSRRAVITTAPMRDGSIVALTRLRS